VRRCAALTSAAALLAAAVTACGAPAGTGAPVGSAGEITIGTLYSGSGSFAASSGPEFAGLKYWISQVNAAGGVYVRAAGRTEKVKLVAYDDQSSPTTASTLYNQLITQDHVNILVSDFGSVLTAPAVTIAEEHKQLLFDPSGSGASLFTAANPYIVLTSLPTSAVWPAPLADFLISRKISRVAIIYDANDFDQSQEQTLAAQLTRAGVTPVFNKSVPTTATDYAALIQSVRQAQPQAVLEFGYQNNDIDFLNDLRSAGAHFPMVFTAFPGQLTQLLQQNVGTAGLAYTFTYGFPPEIAYSHVTVGMTTKQFVSGFQAASHSAVNFLDIAGYTAGLTIQAALQHATTLSQLGLRSGLSQVSGTMSTIEGKFKIDSTGAQLGETLPVAQVMPRGGGTAVEVVYPPGKAQVAAKYPAPLG
jgi:branched-chain amino acid transport system substrate-binding protein